MKTKILVSVFMVIGIVLVFANQGTFGEDQEGVTAGGLNIGVVSIRKIIENSKRNTAYREQAMQERQKAEAELEKLAKDIDAEEAGLKTLKSDSEDYLARAKEFLAKRASYEPQKEFYERQLSLKDQKWTMQLYTDILEATKQVAEEKGLDLVFEKSEPDLSTNSAQDLVLAIRTHKVLYSKDHLDISDDVISIVDGKK